MGNELLLFLQINDTDSQNKLKKFPAATKNRKYDKLKKFLCGKHYLESHPACESVYLAVN